MNYRELKKIGLYYLENRKENLDVEISEEDIASIDKFKAKTYVYPTITFFSILTLKYLWKYLPTPSLFDNPIEPDQRTLWRRKFFGKFFANQMIFVCTLGTVLFTLVRYEFAKYYLYLKYENLVDAYLAAKDAEMIKSMSVLEFKQQNGEN